MSYIYFCEHRVCVIKGDDLRKRVQAKWSGNQFYDQLRKKLHGKSFRGKFINDKKVN